LEYSNDNPVVPINPNINYDKVEEMNTNYNYSDEKILKEYQSIMGHVMYIMVCTRPDIAYAVSKFSRYLQKPTAFHLKGVKLLVRYLYNTRHLCLTFCRKNTGEYAYRLEAYADSDWAADIKTRRSHTGGLITLGKTPVMWLSTLQPTVSISSAEAEIKALKEVTRNVLWLRHLILDTGLIKILTPISIYEDNQSTIQMVSNPEVSIKNRHTDIAYRFITENINEFNTIKLIWIQSENNPADMFTKSLREAHFLSLQRLLYQNNQS
jgi:hypothetical protein